MTEKEGIIIPFEQVQATRVVAICDSLSQATLSNDIPNIGQEYHNLITILRSHQGSPFLTEVLQREELPKIIQSPDSGFIASFPERIGIFINRKEDDLARERVKRELGVDLPKKENTYGILTREGAKLFELRELVTNVPSSISTALKDGRIGDAEREKNFRQEGALSFLDHYGEHFNSQENLSLVLRAPDAQDRWRRREEAEIIRAEKNSFI